MQLNAQLDNCVDYLEFNVTDIERTKAFYGEAFGWEFVDYGDTYCEFSDGRMKGGFTTLAPVNTGGPLVVLYHKDLELLIDKVTAAGGQISKEIFGFPGGERFQFIDPDGYELAVWRHNETI